MRKLILGIFICLFLLFGRAYAEHQTIVDTQHCWYINVYTSGKSINVTLRWFPNGKLIDVTYFPHFDFNPFTAVTNYNGEGFSLGWHYPKLDIFIGQHMKRLDMTPDYAPWDNPPAECQQ